MTLFDVGEIFDYHAQHPPVHLMVAAYLGVKTTPERDSVASFDQTEAVAIFAAAGVPVGNVHAGLGTPTFDVVELMSRRP